MEAFPGGDAGAVLVRHFYTVLHDNGTRGERALQIFCQASLPWRETVVVVCYARLATLVE